MNRIPKDKSLMKTISWKTKRFDKKYLPIIFGLKMNERK